MKRIVHLLYSGLGGHGSDFFSLVKSDSESQYSHIAVFCGIEPMREGYEKECRSLGVNFTYIAKKRGADPGFYLRLRKAVRDSAPDTILVYGLSFLPGTFFTGSGNRKPQVIVRDTQAHHLKSKMDWYWLRLAFSTASKIVVLSEESRTYLASKYRAARRPGKVVVIPNAIDTARYSPSPVIAAEVKVIGMQSRLQVIKDHPSLLAAFALLRKQGIATGARLAIAGDGPTRPALEAQALSLGISDSVDFYGMLNEEELIGFMHRVDIYVHATLGEMMSTSIMQAMACGLPVIASDVWGVNNMISDGSDGLLYRSADIEELAGKIKQLLTDPRFREKIAAGARNTATQVFSLPRLFSQYKLLFG